jgi:citrate lyase subunit beta/citryl-CoA lyase
VRTLPIAPLFVPGDRPERFGKAAESGADTVILDLEDGVVPEKKAAARDAVARHGVGPSVPVWVRINAKGSPWFADDIAALRTTRVDAVMLPKTEEAAGVETIAAAFGRSIPVVVLIETAAGMADLTAVLRAENVIGAAFGSLDYALDLGSDPLWETLLFARSEIVLRSRVAGLPAPIDGVCTTTGDAELVKQDAAAAAGLGFGGKLAIHPRQVAAIAAAFRPSAADLAWAQEIVSLAGDGKPVKVAGQMVDRPVLERARRIVRWFDALRQSQG